MGTMSSIDHSSGATADISATVEMAPIVAKLDDLVRLLDFIAKKEVVTIETTPKVEVAPAAVSVNIPPAEPKVAVPITVPMPTVNVANHIDSRWPRILAWLVAGDIITKVAGLAWQMAFTMK